MIGLPYVFVVCLLFFVLIERLLNYNASVVCPTKNTSLRQASEGGTAPWEQLESGVCSGVAGFICRYIL